MKETFIIRTEWREAIFELPDAEQAEVFRALFDYHAGNLINLNNLTTKLVWKLIEPSLKRNVEAYDRRSETSSENGKKGGRPKKEAEENLNNLKKPIEKPIETKEPIESLSVCVSDSVYDSVNVNDLIKKSEAEKISATHPEELISFNSDFEKKENTHRVPPAPPLYGDGELHRQCRKFAADNQNKYPPEMYVAFLNYWTAAVQNGKKSDIGRELWKIQETFQLASRLSTWFSRESNKYQQNGKSNTLYRTSKTTGRDIVEQPVADDTRLEEGADGVLRRISGKGIQTFAG